MIRRTLNRHDPFHFEKIAKPLVSVAEVQALLRFSKSHCGLNCGFLSICNMVQTIIGSISFPKANCEICYNDFRLPN